MLVTVPMPLLGQSTTEGMVVSLIMLVLVAFLPSIIYLIVIRYVEKYDREPWGSMFTVFLWGATMGVVVVIIARGVFNVHFPEKYPDLASDRELMTLISAVLITPIVAELIKPAGLLFVRYDIEESEDGLIYGAVSGLGYAASENLLYGIFIINYFGLNYFVSIVIIRSISVVLLNSATTAITGYGVSRATAIKHRVGSIFAFPLFLFVAIGCHAGFNYLVARGLNMSDIFNVSSGLLFAIILSMWLMGWIYFKIYRLDRTEVREAKKAEKEEGWGDEFDQQPMMGRPSHSDENYDMPPRHQGYEYPPPNDFIRSHHSREPPDFMHSRGPPQPRYPPRREHPPPHYDERPMPPRAQHIGGGSGPPPGRPTRDYRDRPERSRPGPERRFGERPPGRAPEREPYREDRRERRRPPSKPRREPEPRVDFDLDWEEGSEEDGVAWEEEDVEEVRPPPKRKGGKKKIEWVDEEDDTAKIKERKKKDEKDEDDWWFDDD